MLPQLDYSDFLELLVYDEMSVRADRKRSNLKDRPVNENENNVENQEKRQ